MNIQERFAAEALALAGVPFRMHGRSAETGVDCVGLVLLACRRAGHVAGPVRGYAARGVSQARAEAELVVGGFRPVADAGHGDVLLVQSGPLQLHLMVRVRDGLVHAHAGLRKVVLMPAPSPWPVLGCWRLAPGAMGA